jgi:putative oxidoreductase
MNRLLFLLRLGVGGTFLYASWPKIMDPVQFAEMVAGYRLLPPELVGFVALILPWLELLAGVGMILGVLSLSSSCWIAFLSLLFLLAKSSAIVRGLDVSCGCFSLNGNSSIAWSDLPANLALLVLSLGLLIRGPGQWVLQGRARDT